MREDPNKGRTPARDGQPTSRGFGKMSFIGSVPLICIIFTLFIIVVTGLLLATGWIYPLSYSEVIENGKVTVVGSRRLFFDGLSPWWGFEGNYCEYREKRLIIKGVYKRNKQIGTWEIFSENGKLKIKDEYVGGIVVRSTTFKEDGSIESISNYKKQ